MKIIEQLQQLGFGQYEAQAYVTLLQESPLNGYELAKVSGIPRANIYTVLQKLEDSGAVMRVATLEGNRYTPVQSGELIAKLQSRYQKKLDAVSASLEQITSPTQVEAVFNFRGYAALLDQAVTLLERTERHLLLSLWPEEAVALAEQIEKAQERGVQITTLCLRGCPQPCPACRGSVFRYALGPENDTRWLVIVSDESELLAGEIQPAHKQEAMTDDSAAVRTRQPMLVHLTGSYIHNSIALANLITHFGDRLSTELDPQSVAALNQLRPFHDQRPWLEIMQHKLHVNEGAA